MSDAVVDINAVYSRYPDLKAVEESTDPRIENRRTIAQMLPKHGVGAELGVFTGRFSSFLIDLTRPKRFYAVDVWHLEFGEHYPDWGVYTGNGALSTAAAYAATGVRVSVCPGGEVVVSRSVPWLNAQPDHHLDWVYLDSSHTYEDTIAELEACRRAVKQTGLISGDDAWPSRTAGKDGVFLALRDFCRRNPYEIVRLDQHGQWCLRRSL